MSVGDAFVLLCIILPVAAFLTAWVYICFFEGR